jgi:hypothetical protein
MNDPVITAILLILRLGIGVILFRLALNPRYRNLHWLAAVFYLNFVNIFVRGSALGPVSQVVMVVIQICLAMFTHTTFHQHRRSPVVWVIAGLVVSGGATLYLTQNVPTYQGPQPMYVMCAVNWFWHALVALQVWLKLRSDRSIEDWIKTRYALVVTYAVVMGGLFVVIVTRVRLPYFGFNVIMMVALVLQYLAWAMPAAMRRYLNRNYQPPTVDEKALGMTEEEALRAVEEEAR